MKYLKTYNENIYTGLVIECNTIHEKKALEDWIFENGYKWNNCKNFEKIDDNSEFWENNKSYIVLVKGEYEEYEYDCLFFNENECDEYENKIVTGPDTIYKKNIIDIKDLPNIKAIIDGYKMDLL